MNARALALAAAAACSPAATGERAGPAASSATPSTAPPPAASSVAAPPAASSVAAPPAEPEPDVEVKNIGIHIGGGPNDAETKAPIKRSVEPRMGELRRCFTKADDAAKGGDVSVDLYIDRAGGRATIKKLTSGIEGAAFEACLRAALESIDFEKPKTGTTVVSYSLRFTPRGK
jgi:hypothetical protein